jgi:hypothetical protein
LLWHLTEIGIKIGNSITKGKKMRNIYSCTLLFICATFLFGQGGSINIPQQRIDGHTWMVSSPEVTDQTLIPRLLIADLTAPPLPYQSRHSLVNIKLNTTPGLIVGEYKTIPAATADLIVIGTVSGGKVLVVGPDSSRDFGVATDYNLQVDTVLKDATGGRVQANAPLTVTRKGGYVRAANGKVFDVADKLFKPLLLGSRYLLFLKTFPQDNTLNVEMAHELIAGRTAQVEQGPVEFDRHKGKKEKDFILEVKRAIAEGIDQ